MRPELPIILCSGFSHTMHADKAQARGLDAFLFKPFAPRDLGFAVHRVFAKHRAQSRSAVSPVAAFGPSPLSPNPSPSAVASPVEQELHLYKVCMQWRYRQKYHRHGQYAPPETIGPVQ